MTKKLYVNVKIFFKNPYVARLDHEAPYGTVDLCLIPSFREAKSKAYKLICGTYGYTNPVYEGSTDLTQPWYSPAGLLRGNLSTPRSYWCFKHEMDALQFRMMIGTRATRVYMWPDSLNFTIFDFTENKEGDS